MWLWKNLIINRVDSLLSFSLGSVLKKYLFFLLIKFIYLILNRFESLYTQEGINSEVNALQHYLPVNLLALSFGN